MHPQVSTHGYSQNQILVWKYPSLTQVAKLTGHSYRVLYLVSLRSWEGGVQIWPRPPSPEPGGSSWPAPGLPGRQVLLSDSGCVVTGSLLSRSPQACEDVHACVFTKTHMKQPQLIPDLPPRI